MSENRPSIEAYYDATEGDNARQPLVDAVARVTQRGVAIDCGCGAGADIAYLLNAGFEVFGFDVEAEAIRRCENRFQTDARVHLSQASFIEFEYPNADLVAADASLFFCPKTDFPIVWEKITRALQPQGIFVGSFLGERDTMLTADYDGDAYWPGALGFNETDLRKQFEQYDILDWVEHELDGHTAAGEPHHWHIYSVIAQISR